jgi:hypothetical protein
MTKDEALRMAIDFLNRDGFIEEYEIQQIIEACKEALAQPTAEQSSLVQEPSAWLYYHNRMVEPLVLEFEEPDTTKKFESDVTWKKPLYTTPSREWVGLSDWDYVEIYGHASLVDWRVVRAIEAKLREKNE